MSGNEREKEKPMFYSALVGRNHDREERRREYMNRKR